MHQPIMIIDCYTHVWESPEQLGLRQPEASMRLSRGISAMPVGGGWPDAATPTHLAASDPVDKSFVLSFKSRYLGVEIPTSLVAQYVRQHPEKLIGVAGVDPTNLSEAIEDVSEAYEVHGMRAITVSPAAQDFHPADSRAMQVFAEAARLRMPVIIDHGHLRIESKMEFARPVLLDEVARELPHLKLVISHMGYPWVEECVVMLGKHPNVFADISSLLHRPWQAYNSLLSAYQFGVIDKLLFGSDFPFTTATTAIESLYRINQLVTGTNLPTVPRAHLAGIVERDAIGLLGITGQSSQKRAGQAELIDTHEG
ncbi:hypothetical protein B7486_11160 [cyanobacterium TDX16]|nr:hypothetical protein B7486_11160 [cyanobacterium TDX16]